VTDSFVTDSEGAIDITDGCIVADHTIVRVVRPGFQGT
jgi:hypothetical protein